MISKFKMWDVVQSHYRARWYGKVVGVNRIKDSYIVTVAVTHDKHGRKQRKTLIKRLNQDWLTKVSDEIYSNF